MESGDWQGVGYGIQGAGNFYGAYQQWKHRNDEGLSLYRRAQLSDAEIPIYQQMAGVYGQTGRAYLGAGRSAVRLGKANAKNIRRSWANLDMLEQFALREAATEATQRIGAGRAGFAGNGVLVDSGSAALWEQDEVADAALEQLDIMQQFENEGYNLRVQAWQAEAEGYSNAAGYAGQAAGAFGQGLASMQQAYTASLQSLAYRQQAREANRRNKHSWINSAVQGLGYTARAIAVL